MTTVDIESCPGCGALFPPSDGPTHRYIGASAGCWALYSPMIVGEAPDPTVLASSRVPDASPSAPTEPVQPAAGALLVDAYAAQHHGDDSPQAIQSVAVHLLTLHGVLRRGADPAKALWVRRRAVRTRGVFSQLQPPPLGSALTLRHLFPGGGVARPSTAIDYVESVYLAWAALHEATLSVWYDRYVIAG